MNWHMALAVRQDPRMGGGLMVPFYGVPPAPPPPSTLNRRRGFVSIPPYAPSHLTPVQLIRCSRRGAESMGGEVSAGG
jgi:hypothetical protein